MLDLGLHPRQMIRWLENEKSIAAAKHLKDRAAEGEHVVNFGNTYADLGDARKAIEHYEQRLSIAREFGERRGEANVCWRSDEVCIDFEREIWHPDAEKNDNYLKNVPGRLVAML